MLSYQGSGWADLLKTVLLSAKQEIIQSCDFLGITMALLRWLSQLFSADKFHSFAVFSFQRQECFQTRFYDLSVFSD